MLLGFGTAIYSRKLWNMVHDQIIQEDKAIQEKLTELAKREAEVYRIPFEKEKELTDRALKLAEVSKPKSNWELQEILGLAVFVLGFLVTEEYPGINL